MDARRTGSISTDTHTHITQLGVKNVSGRVCFLVCWWWRLLSNLSQIALSAIILSVISSGATHLSQICIKDCILTKIIHHEPKSPMNEPLVFINPHKLISVAMFSFQVIQFKIFFFFLLNLECQQRRIDSCPLRCCKWMRVLSSSRADGPSHVTGLTSVGRLVLFFWAHQEKERRRRLRKMADNQTRGLYSWPCLTFIHEELLL